jgi:hypothetical protein
MIDAQFYHPVNVTFLQEYASVLKTTYSVITNVYAGLHGSWAINDHFINLPKESYEIYFSPEYFNLKNGSLRYYVDEIILVGNSHASFECFGHFFTDILEPLFMIPEETLERCFIACSSALKYIKTTLVDLGISESQLIMMDKGEWFYANKMHCFYDYRPFIAYGGDAVENIKIRFQKYYNTGWIIPTDYTIVNRDHCDRSMSNVPELIKALNENFPEIKWRTLPDNIGSLKKAALKYAKIRILFSIQGSNTFRAIFMQNHTIICLGLTQELDLPTARFLGASRIFVYYFNSDIIKYSFQKMPVNITNAVNSVRKALELDKKKLFLM